MDWLPDEVISNVLVHLVSAPSREPRTRADVATSPRTPHPPNPPPPPRAPRRRRQSGPPHRVPHERSPQPEPRPADEPSSHDPPRPLAARPRRRALQHRQPQGPQAVRGRRRVEGALRQALRHSPREPRQARVRMEHPVPDPPQRALLAVQGRREAIARGWARATASGAASPPSRRAARAGCPSPSAPRETTMRHLCTKDETRVPTIDGRRVRSITRVTMIKHLPNEDCEPEESRRVRVRVGGP